MLNIINYFRFVTNRFFIAPALASLIALSLLVHASWNELDNLRLSPLHIHVDPDSKLPPDIQTLEQTTVSHGFDRDTNTEYTAYGDSKITLELSQVTEISQIKIYNAAPYSISVQAWVSGSWQPIDGLQALNLSSLTDKWHVYTVTTAVSTDRLQISLSSSTGGSALGLKELEIWGKAERTTINTGANLLAAVESEQPPVQARVYAATPEEGIIGHVVGLADEADDNTFSINLDQDMGSVKRAWLSYESHGAGHWVSVSRSINNQASMGGSYRFASTAWAGQIEAINPAWLVTGKNSVTFSVPEGSSYRIRKLKILVELDNGSNLVKAITAVPESINSTAKFTHDGDNLSGWKPYGSTLDGKEEPYLQLIFDKSTQLYAISLQLDYTLQGKIELETLKNGEWANAGVAAVLGKNLVKGWNYISIQNDQPVDGIKLLFRNGAGSTGEILEIAPIGSGVGSQQSPPHIEVGYPDAGQYYGDSAYIRGFVQPFDNGSGKVKTFIAGREVSRQDGAFEALVNKDEFTEELNKYSVTVDALYPDGIQVSRKIYLTDAYDASTANATLQTYAYEGKATDVNNTPSVEATEVNLKTAISPIDIYRIEHDESVLQLSREALEKNERPSAISITSLKHEDLPPLNLGMTNVTKGPRNGYRFAPHGKKFKKNIDVYIPYDKTKIPPGLSEDDIKTWYFDEEVGRWVALDKVAIDTKTKVLKSHSDHFTDMIAATITVPDSPQAASFNPTQIKDIKAADPGAGINLIEPPQTNNQGSANLSYPIEIPAGRNGMQPQLAISYNSGGGNGWLGMGWDLSVPSITIETRWGVPRYSVTEETETYLLNGQQMTPLAHRGELQPRENNKDDFRLRVEGSFQKIKRHGTTPKNYWWEVTDKNGTRNFYGSEGDGQTSAALLGGDKGVFKWMLKKTVDTNGNTVVYHYDKVCDSGTGLGGCITGVKGYQLYISSIDYTGHASESEKNTPYAVKFIRDKALGKPRRADIIIDARGGFKQVTSEVLKEIEVLYQGSVVRSYDLDYREGAFKKTLLETIVQKDNDGTEFNRHELAYYDEVTSTGTSNKMVLFDVPKSVDTGTDNIKESLLGAVKYPSTLIGGSSGVGGGGNGYVGLGFPLIGNYLHAAATVKASASRSDSKIMLIDINGDGLQDKVFERNGRVYYRRNTTDVKTDIVSFSTEAPLAVGNLSRLSKNKSSSWAKGVKAKAFVVNTYADSSTTITTDDVYFSDVNGDGMVDQVSSGQVYFNHIDTAGKPAFTSDSGITDSPIVAGAVNADILLADMVDEGVLLEKNNPLMDAIRRWKAPYTGRIRITSTAQLHNFMDDPSLSEEQRRDREEYEHSDGVRLSVQHNDQLKQSVELGGEQGDNYDSITINVPAFNITEGDTIYFRTHSKHDGNYDRVEWNPSVHYVSNTGANLTHLDSNLLNSYSFNAKEDFVLSGREIKIALPNFGTVKLEGVLNKTAITSDDIDVAVTVYDVKEDGNGGVIKTKIDSLSFVDQLDANAIGEINFDRTFDVKKDQEFIFSVTSDSAVDLRNLTWENNKFPTLRYMSAYEPEHELFYPPVDSNATDQTPIPASIDDLTISEDDLTESAGHSERTDIPVIDETGKPLIVVPVLVNTDIYTGNTLNGQPQQAWVADKSGVLLMTPWVSLVQHEDKDCEPLRAENYECEEGIWAPDGAIAFTVKNKGRLVSKSIIEVENKNVVSSTQGYDALIVIPVVKGEQYFFDFSIKNARLANEVLSSKIYYGYGSDIGWKAPFSENVNFKTVLKGNIPDNDLNSDNEVISQQLMMLVRNDTEIIYQKLATFTGSHSEAVDEYILNADKNKKYYFDFFTVSQNLHIYDKSVWGKYSGEPVQFLAPKSGTVQITPKLLFTSSIIDGNIELRISKNNGDWYRKTYTVINGVIPEANLKQIELKVSKNDTLHFEFVTTDPALSSYLKTKGDVLIDYVDQTNWSVSEAWVDDSSAVELSLQPELTFNQSTKSLSGEFIYRVWFKNTLVQESTLTVTNGQASYPSTLPIKQIARQGDELSFEFSSSNRALIAAITKAYTIVSSKARVANISTITNIVGLTQKPYALHVLMPSKVDNHIINSSTENHFSIDDTLYGNSYRGWGYIGYYANEPYSDDLIDITRLRLKTEDELRDTASVDTIYLSLPNVGNHRWNSIDPNWWISSSAMSSSRLGLDDVWVPVAADYKTAGAKNVVRTPRRSNGKTYAYGGGLDFFTVNNSKSRSTGELELIDLNGDRFPDMVGSGHVQYTLPTGQMGETTNVLSSTNTTRNDNQTYSTGPSSGFAAVLSAAAKTYQQGDKARSSEVKQNLSFFDVGLSASIGKGDSEAEIQMTDINGDGLPDRVYQSGSSIYVQLNLGYTFEAKELWGTAKINDSLNQNVGLSSLSYSVNGGSRQLKDMNGDGLVDYVDLRSNNTVWVSFNTGASFANAVLVEGLLSTTGEIPGVSSIPGFEAKPLLYDGASLSVSQSLFNYSANFTIWALVVPVIDIVWGGSASVSATMSQPTIGFNDINGDGLIDGIQSKTDSGAIVVINATRYTNLLKSVSRPLGASFNIEYKRTGNTYDLPSSRWVMSQVSVFDGAGSDTPSNDLTTGSDYKAFTYDYIGGKQDRYEREFLGFGQVVQNELNTADRNVAVNAANDAIFTTARLDDLSALPIYRQSTQTYLNNSFYTKGLLVESTTKGRNNPDGSGELGLYRKTENDYVLKHVITGNKLNDLSLTAQQLQLKAYRDKGDSIFPMPVRTEQFFYEGDEGQYKSTKTENDFDDYGNVIWFKDYADQGTADDIVADITYSHTDSSCFSNGITGKPTQIIVKNSTDNVLRHRQADYACTTGNLTAIHQYLADGTAATTTMDAYDAYGNLTEVTGPANDADSGGDSLKMAFTYDAITHTYPTTIRNKSYGLESTTSYDYKFGKPLCTLDVNGNPMRYSYDQYGRTSRITGPYEQPAPCSDADNGSGDSGPFTIKFTYSPYVNLAGPRTLSVAKTEHYNRDADNNELNTIDTWLFTDGIKRVLQTKKTAMVDQGGTVTPGRIVSGRVSFDALGRSIKQYYPVFETSNAATDFNTDTDGTQATFMAYDALDRNLSTVLPDDTTTSIAYDFAGGFAGATLSNYFSTTVTDANGKQKQTYRDTRELIHAVKEEGELLTIYQYDALKQITKVTDADNNHTQVSYDNLGRRIAINNPDTGNTDYKYDLASNLIEKITANQKGKVGILYGYDHTRLGSITYPNDTANNVSYTYGDESKKALNQAGRIITVTHQSGSDTREYGKLGEVTKETKVISVASNGGSPVPSYTTEYDFDTFGRLMTLTLPDGELIKHRYNAAGNLDHISGRLDGTDYAYLENLTYDKFEQRRSMTLGNGIHTRYHYNPQHRRLCKLETGLTLSNGNDNQCETLPRVSNTKQEETALTSALSNITASNAGQFQNLHYAYDQVGNILGTSNAVQIPQRREMGGPTVQTFQYDDLYRLETAKGSYLNAQGNEHRYTLDMAYNSIHNITSKDQLHEVISKNGGTRTQTATTYDWNYQYTGTQPHAPTHIGSRTFSYDANGNQIGWTHDKNGTKRNITWDDENRIQKIGDPSNTLTFAYDDSGQRVLKRGQHGQTEYINQFFTVRNNALHSKHIFAGTSRISTKVEPGQPVGKFGSGDTSTTTTTSTATTGTETTLLQSIQQSASDVVTEVKTFFGIKDSHPGQGLEHRSDRANEVAQNTKKNKHLNGGTPGGEHGKDNSNKGGNGNNGNNTGNQGSNGNGNDNGNTNPDNGNTGKTGGGNNKATYDYGGTFLYYYHPDHLGSTGYVTDENAELYEHVEYFPFGETWLQEAANTLQRVPYRYTGKELDEETGLYYYGARYYDPRTSVWLSADAVLGEYLPTGDEARDQNLPGMGGVFNSRNLGLYTYTHNNPVRYTDPDGNMADDAAVWTAAFLEPSPFGEVAAAIYTAGKYTLAAMGVLSLSGDTTQDSSHAQAQTSANTQTKESDGPSVIYRWGSGSNTNMTPREKDKQGLSFSTQKPATGKFTTTTMEAVNSTGSLMAVKDGASHVSIMPTNPSEMQGWINSRPNSEANPHQLTNTLQSVVIKDD